MTIRYISLCSGIECASVAAAPLGWEPICFAEIEPFPSAVLAHHYPNVPNVGDMTRHDWSRYRGRCDLVVAGTPCQAFSVAGRGESLADARGNLTLKFAEICDVINPEIIVWENVPGVLNKRDNAFGCLLGALVGESAALVAPGGKWPDAGLVDGPGRRAAWRVLDAQYFGLAQRRRRVFLVASPRASGIHPGAVLFESEGLRRDSPPRRGEAEDVAGTLEASVGRSRGAGTPVGVLSAVAGTLNCNHKAAGSATQQDADQGLLVPLAFGGNNTAAPIDISPALRAHDSPQYDFESDAFICAPVVAGALGGGSDERGWCNDLDRSGAFIAHTLRGDGFDASEDGTGRGTPITPVAFHPSQDPISNTDVSHAVGCGCSRGQANVAVAVALRGRDGGNMAELGGDVANSLSTSGGGADRPYVLHYAVRRLIPRECERLQGLEDDYTLVPYTARYLKTVPFGKLLRDYLRYLRRDGHKTFRECHPGLFPDDTLAADGPRYKAIGNGMAVPCIGWVVSRVNWAWVLSSR